MGGNHLAFAPKLYREELQPRILEPLEHKLYTIRTLNSGTAWLQDHQLHRIIIATLDSRILSVIFGCVTESV